MRPAGSEGTWKQLGARFVSCCHGAQEAVTNQRMYLSQGYRDVVYEAQDVSEMVVAEAEVTIAVDPNDSTRYLDYFDQDAEVMDLRTIINTTTGYRMIHEPDGFDGRARFQEAPSSGTRTTPGKGGPLWWVREGSRIYVRPRPDEATTLRISYRQNPSALTAGDLNDYPRTPSYLDMAIVYRSAYHFYLMNPQADQPDGQMVPFSQKYLDQSSGLIQRAPTPDDREEKFISTTINNRAFHFRPRSAR